jgi:hypothetical protein
MRSRSQSFRAVLAAGLSLWLAVLACLMGCAIPAFASSSANQPAVAHAFSSHESPAPSSEPDMMADMPNCPHHSGTNLPSKPNAPKPAHSGGMSCCPVEVTVAAKPHMATLHIALPSHSFLLADFSPASVQVFRSAEFAPILEHSGRDTLLQTQLLRI